MPRGQKLLKFLASLMLDSFHGVVIIRIEAGKVTHVETETRRSRQNKDLPRETAGASGLAHNRCP